MVGFCEECRLHDASTSVDEQGYERATCDPSVYRLLFVSRRLLPLVFGLSRVGIMIGKLIGAGLGSLTLGVPIGTLLGLAAGHFFDVGRGRVSNRLDPEERAKVEKAFFNALFPVLGYLAKADGRVSPEEIQSTEELIKRMGLNSDMRAEAIQLFNDGKQDGYDLSKCLPGFSEVSKGHNDIKRIFIVYLITLALADGTLDSSEEQVLQQVAEQIDFSRFAFNQLIGMVRAQMAFREKQANSQSGYSYYEQAHNQGTNQYYSEKNELELAYQAIGVSETASDTEIKRAYRKLMSENHPDKLSGQGVPEEMVKLATERSQEIQTAYDLIKKHRKGR